MTNDEIKKLHIVQTKNVKYLKKAMKNLTMDINNSLLKGDDFKVGIKTKFYCLLYSALSESQFLQILYTPYGFMYSEIEKIQKGNAIFDKWKLMVDLAIKKNGDYTTNTDLEDKRGKLKSIICEYIEGPQLLRNKIAHGQWIHALNRKNTKENKNITLKIENLNVVEISKWFEVHQYLCFIIRDLIQSPSKGFHNNYWVNLTSLEAFLDKSKNWTIEKKIEDIKRKYNNRPKGV
jgi:hypothetical protein